MRPEGKLRAQVDYAQKHLGRPEMLKTYFHKTALCLALAACSEPPSAKSSQHLQLTAAAAGSAAPGPGVPNATCYTPLSTEHPAAIEFRRVFAAGEYENRDKALAELAAAATAHPHEEEFAVLHGLGNLWRAAEAQTPLDGLNAFGSAQTAVSELDRAYTMCPSDVRVLAWLGPAKIMLGQLLLDSAEVEAGQKLLDFGIERYRLFATFGNIILYAGSPTDDPMFARALESARFFLNAAETECVQSTSRVCINSPSVPRNIEGTAVYLGDVFARAQDRASALRAYEAARATPEYASWQFRSVVETRIQTLDARMEASANWLGLDDHELAGNASSQCLYCHAD